jgi:hypothetical protein
MSNVPMRSGRILLLSHFDKMQSYESSFTYVAGHLKLTMHAELLQSRIKRECDELVPSQSPITRAIRSLHLQKLNDKRWSFRQDVWRNLFERTVLDAHNLQL